MMQLPDTLTVEQAQSLAAAIGPSSFNPFSAPKTFEQMVEDAKNTIDAEAKEIKE